jgi:hypothetical protein
MSKLSKRHFWDWFKRHHPEYLTLNTKSKKETTYWLNELNVHLRAYYKFFEFTLGCQKQTATLTITVNGKAIHFKKVDDLVAKAPAIPGWTIIALEDPRPIDFFLAQQMKDTGIDPREFYFSFASDDPNGVALTVYHPLCIPANEYLIHELANSAVYNLLGERSFGTDISWLQVANLSAADPADIKKLEALPEHIGLRRSGVVVDGEGNLVIN